MELEFSGGMELLVKGHKHAHSLPLPESVQCIGDLLPFVRDTLINGDPDLFMQGSTIRPGVLILINDVDWELEGELDYQLSDGDSIVFISTLHGG